MSFVDVSMFITSIASIEAGVVEMEARLHELFGTVDSKFNSHSAVIQRMALKGTDIVNQM